MLSILLSWVFCLSPSTHSTKMAAADSLSVSGTCWDVTTGMNLKSSITALVNGKKRKIGPSNANGEFTLRLADSTQALFFEVAGYPTRTIPLNLAGQIERNSRFTIHLPFILPDSQRVINTYRATDRSVDQPTTLSRKARKVYFRVQDARAFRRIPATICFTDSPSGRTHCVEIDPAKAPSFVVLNPGEKITYEVRAEGYQTYRGTLIPGQSGAIDELYQIKLLMLTNMLAVAYDVPANRKLTYEFRSIANESRTSRINVPVPYFDQNFFKPGEVYRFIATMEAGNVAADDTFRMAEGINFLAFRLSPPDQTRLVSDGSVKAAFFDSTVLYFDQSDYSLRQEAKGKLDSISWRMLRHRNVLARLTGHSDNVGRRALNLTLSEYRTRVVAGYLQQKGIPSDQLSASWKGPDAPAAPNDTEENKAKNRRVVIRFFQSSR